MVACQPKQDILACGYSDGTVLMVRLEGRRGDPRPQETARRRLQRSAGNAKGTLLAFADEEGNGGILPL